MRQNVSPSAMLLPDDWQAYRPLHRDFVAYRKINHSIGLYMDGDIHTNTIEGFFGNMKTAIRGTYKHVSHKGFSPT